MGYLTWRNGLGDGIKLKMLRWEHFLDNLSAPNIITKGLTRERQDGQGQRSDGGSRRWSDVWPWAGGGGPLEGGKGETMDSPLESPERTTSADAFYPLTSRTVAQ